MRLRRLTGLERDKIRRYDDLVALIADLIFGDVATIIKEELKKSNASSRRARQVWGVDDRRSPFS